MAYPYMIMRPGEETTGLLSRHPILAEEWLEPASGGRSTLHVVVDWDGVEVSVHALHPLPPGLDWYESTGIPIGLHDAGPRRQAVEVAERAASEDGLVLIIGDFNLTDRTRAYSSVAERFVDAYREAGWGFGFTFPEGVRIGKARMPGPLTRIDFIFRSDGFCTRWARVGCGGGTDHCYVLAQLGREDS